MEFFEAKMTFVIDFYKTKKRMKPDELYKSSEGLNYKCPETLFDSLRMHFDSYKRMVINVFKHTNEQMEHFWMNVNNEMKKEESSHLEKLYGNHQISWIEKGFYR
uniref:Uncharacterized protein n=1 Tax=Caenorhabditis tropicalis TaxID=1561998 RepID=A0A1I7T8E2_9PELO